MQINDLENLAKKYRREIHPIKYDYKPSIENIIKWVQLDFNDSYDIIEDEQIQ